MYLEIVTPEATLFKGEVTSVAVPGVNGEFEMLTNHAPIVSLLKEGHAKLHGENIEFEEEVEDNKNYIIIPVYVRVRCDGDGECTWFCSGLYCSCYCC